MIEDVVEDAVEATDKAGERLIIEVVLTEETEISRRCKRKSTN